MHNYKTSSFFIVGLSLCLAVYHGLLGCITVVTAGESAPSMPKPPNRFGAPSCARLGKHGLVLPTLKASKDNLVDVRIDSKFKKEIQSMAESLEDNPNTILVIKAYRSANEDLDIDIKRAEYIRDILIAGNIGAAIAPTRIGILGAGVPTKNQKLSGKETVIYKCVNIESSMGDLFTPKLNDFPESALSFFLKNGQEEIRNAILEYFKSEQLPTKQQITDDGLNIITVYDYDETGVGRRKRRGSYLIQIGEQNKDRVCMVKLKYLVESCGEREKTWAATDDDRQIKPRKLKTISEKIPLLLSSK